MASSMTLADIRNILRLQFPSSNQFSDAVLDKFINWTIKDIVYRMRPPEFESTDETHSIPSSSSTRVISVADIDPLAIISVKNTTNDTLWTKITLAQAEAYDEDETGEPTQYVRYSTDIRFYPLASSDYYGDTLRIQYISKPSVLTSDTSTSPLPDYFDEAIPKGALVHCYHFNGEVERTASAFKAYIGALNSRRHVEATEFDYTDRTIGPNLTDWSP